MNRRDHIRDDRGFNDSVGSPKGPPRNTNSGLTPNDTTFREPEVYKILWLHNGSTYYENTVNSPRRRHVTKRYPVQNIHGDKVKPNPFYMNVDDFRFPVGTAYSETSQGRGVNLSGSCTSNGNAMNNWREPIISTDPAMPAAIYNEAVSRFYEKVGSTMMLNVEVFEAASLRHRKTLDKECGKLEQVAKKIRRRAEKSRGLVRTIGRLWLLNQYVIKPAVNSIFDSSLRVLQQHQRPVYIKTSASRTFPVDRDHTFTYGYGVPNTPSKEVGQYRMVQKFGCVLQSNDLGVQDFITMDPLLLGYSILPLSFVLDWAFNVSAFLADKEASCRYQSQFKYGYSTKSWKYESTFRSDMSWSSSDGFYRSGSVHTRGSSLRRGFKRTVLTSLPKVQAPVVDVQLGAHRLLSCASLLSQLLSPGRDYDYRRNFR